MPDQPEPPATDETAEPQDLKSKFREALERKQARSQAGQDNATGNSKVHDAHGRAGAKRQHRRKSG
ncbi:DUF5302 domain-containing protein [Actinokineospora sp. PR83]|uniref:DUF5302 domain-containing protein n=1 Tax=Actinokineospora sp. PR83 TaxID=2884908 RepID=UPI001F2791B5|nr:DUF5302 domain-containing protein [Actinokineospora sp. PR83]MCG8919904.1 DUF5302 domain-containing protein [Actinokineospora sp. PR83]